MNSRRRKNQHRESHLNEQQALTVGNEIKEAIRNEAIIESEVSHYAVKALS